MLDASWKRWLDKSCVKWAFAIRCGSISGCERFGESASTLVAGVGSDEISLDMLACSATDRYLHSKLFLVHRWQLFGLFSIGLHYLGMRGC